MKRIHLLALLLATFIAVPLFAVSRGNVIDDVVRMHKAGVAEDEIIAYLHKTDARFDVSADDLIALHDAGVPRMVIKTVLDEADARGERQDRDRSSVRDSGYGPRLYVVGGYPYAYDPFYYDPWWYGYGFGPRFSIGLNFGFGRHYGGYRGGHFRHRH